MAAQFVPLFLVVSLFAGGILGPQSSQLEVELQAAIRMETVEGDLKGAIEQYSRIAEGSDRALAARALVRMGQCYEKLGDTEARKAYERTLSEFSDQTEAAETARARLAAMSTSGAGTGPEIRRLWEGRWIEPSSVSADGRLVAMTEYETGGSLILYDVVTGEMRRLTQAAFKSETEWEYIPPNGPVISSDGQLVVYPWFFAPGTVEVRSIRADGSGMRTHLVRTEATDYLYPAAVSPDEQKAILCSNAGENCQILSLAENSTESFAGGGLKLMGISFSPDSKQVVYCREKEGIEKFGGIYLADPDGSNERPLLVEQSNLLSPFWSGDGKRIVFLSDRSGNSSLWALPVTGGIPELLKEDLGRVNPVGLARDGSFLYWTDSGGFKDVQAVKLDPASLSPRGEPKRLINSQLGRNSRATFSPNGKWLAWNPLLDSPTKIAGQFPDMEIALTVRPTEGGEMQVLTVRGQKGPPGIQWFRDSRAVLEKRLEDGQLVLERFEVPGAQRTEICRVPISSANWMFSAVPAPNGEEVWFLRCTDRTGETCEIARCDIQNGSKTDCSIGGPDSAYPLSYLAVSRDGRSVAFGAPAETDSDLTSLFVIPSGDGKPVEVARSSQDAAIQPWKGLAWTPDDKNLMYVVEIRSGSSTRTELRAVPRVGGTPKSIQLEGIGWGGISISPDWTLVYQTSNPGAKRELWRVQGLPGL